MQVQHNQAALIVFGLCETMLGVGIDMTARMLLLLLRFMNPKLFSYVFNVFVYDCLTERRSKELQLVFDEIIASALARFQAHGRVIAKPTCLLRVTFLCDDICVQAN